jgi:transcription elongation factor Elf1
MSLPWELYRMTQIAAVITEGKPRNSNDLPEVCPYCNTPNLMFSFTVIKPPLYGLFIVCKNCGRHQHFTFGTKPSGFREDLILDEFQQLEDEAANFVDRLSEQDRQRSGPFNEQTKSKSEDS